jgi:hypothetical protein
MLLYIETGFCCASPRHAKTSLSRPNNAGAEQQIALRSLIGDVKRAIAELAVAERHYFSIREQLFWTRLVTREAARRHKGTGGGTANG